MLFVRQINGSGDIVAFAVALVAVIRIGGLLRSAIAVQLIVGAVLTLIEQGA